MSRDAVFVTCHSSPKLEQEKGSMAKPYSGVLQLRLFCLQNPVDSGAIVASDRFLPPPSDFRNRDDRLAVDDPLLDVRGVQNRKAPSSDARALYICLLSPRPKKRSKFILVHPIWPCADA